MVPMVLCPTEAGSPSGLAKEPGSKRSRKVFLATQREEDLWWAAESVSFVIDTGLQKKRVVPANSLSSLANEQRADVLLCLGRLGV